MLNLKIDNAAVARTLGDILSALATGGFVTSDDDPNADEIHALAAALAEELRDPTPATVFVLRWAYPDVVAESGWDDNLLEILLSGDVYSTLDAAKAAAQVLLDEMLNGSDADTQELTWKDYRPEPDVLHLVAEFDDGEGGSMSFSILEQEVLD